MISAPIITGKTVSGRPVYTISVTGIPAHDIEEANLAHFYGIHAMYCPSVIPGRIAAEDAVHEAITRSGMNWNSYRILKARTIDTTGTPVPYKAEIDFVID